MANTTIPQLNQVSAATDLDFLVITNSGETTTSKITRQDLLDGAISSVFDAGNGTDSIKANYLAGTDASNTNTFAVGNGATATGQYSSVVGGQNGLASGSNSISLGGSGNQATGWQSFVAGYSNISEGEITSVFGNQNRANGQASGVFTGTNNRISASQQANHKENFVAGGLRNNITDSLRCAIIAGSDNTITAGTSNSVIIAATGITATADNTLYVDNLNVAGTNNVAGLVNGTGTDSLKSADNLTTTAAVSSNTNSIALGNGAKASGSNSITIGTTSVNSGNNSINIGLHYNSADNVINIGNGAYTYQANGISIGQSSGSQQGGIVLGNSSRAGKTGSLTFGNNNEHNQGNYSVSIGNEVRNGIAPNYYGAEYSVAIGHNHKLEGNTENGQNYSTILGGSGNVLTGNTSNVVLLGLNNFTSPAMDNTTYVDNIHILKTESKSTITGQTATGSVSVDLSTASVFEFDITGNITDITFTNWREGGIYEFVVHNTGSYTITSSGVRLDGVANTIFAKSGSLNPTNNGYTFYRMLIVNGIGWLNESLNFQAL